jgi:hypothetical protein
MRLRFTLMVLACSFVAACGAQGQNAISPTILNAPQGADLKTPAPSLYVADKANNSIDVFASSNNGDVTPSATISGPNTGLGSPVGVAVGLDGTIYVSNDAPSGSITVYAPLSTGDAVPIKTLTCGGLAQPAGISLDGLGNLFVANAAGRSISVFAPTDSGCVTGNRIIVGDHTCLLEPRDVDVRVDGTAYVASRGSVEVYAPGASGDAMPKRKITGSKTMLETFSEGVSLDSTFNIYVTSIGAHRPGRVTVYSPMATGDVAPIRMISGPASTLNAVNKIELDATDEAFVTNGAAIDVFAAGANGPVAPTRIIAGSNTTLNMPMGLDIRP